jgi:hypothetical protein
VRFYLVGDLRRALRSRTNPAAGGYPEVGILEDTNLDIGFAQARLGYPVTAVPENRADMIEGTMRDAQIEARLASHSGILEDRCGGIGEGLKYRPRGVGITRNKRCGAKNQST